MDTEKDFWQLQTLNYRVSAFHLQNKAVRAKHADIELLLLPNVSQVDIQFIK